MWPWRRLLFGRANDVQMIDSDERLIFAAKQAAEVLRDPDKADDNDIAAVSEDLDDALKAMGVLQ